MSQRQHDVADWSRDLGAWSSDSADVYGVDEVSLCMKVMSAAVDAMRAHHERQSRFPVGPDPHETFGPDQMTAPPVIGI
jgi:hypothetical protein